VEQLEYWRAMWGKRSREETGGAGTTTRQAERVASVRKGTEHP